MDWKTFKGAQYAIGQESPKITWHEARSICQSAGADLASLHTHEIVVFIYTQFYYEYSDAWVGGTDSEEEGVFKWVNGVPFEYVFPSSSECNIDQYYNIPIDKDCLFMSYGKWARVEDKRCTSKLHKYLCQKGVSESKFWNEVEGKEYGYYELEDYDCSVPWEYALGKCEEVGGTLASIPSQTVNDQLMNLFADSITTTYGFWIGYKRKGNRFEWTDGETSTWARWSSSEPRDYHNHDCTRVSKYYQTWGAKECSNDRYYKGGLCVKGSTASWAKSGRKRRSTLNETTDVASLVKSERFKRSTDAATSREITCEPLWGNTAGYWSFPYKVPAYCHSNYIE